MEQSKFIEHSDVVDFIGLILLLENYCNEIDKYEISEGKFINDLESNSFDISQKDHLINNLSQKSSSGNVVDFIFDEKNDLQIAFSISHLSNRITVVFRSMIDEFEWYCNTPSMMNNLEKKIHVNTFFYNQLSENMCKIEKIIQDLSISYPTYNIFFTGYSLGGALSLLSSYFITKKFSHVHVTNVTFGSPRVGDLNWKESFEDLKNLTHYRITNDKDILTALPLMNYVHVGININLELNNYKIYNKENNYPWYQYTIFNCWNTNNRDIKHYLKNLIRNKWGSDYI